IGKGPEHAKLVKLAGPTVTFITNASDEDVAEHMKKAEAFIIAAFEDFGITPVEAMAAGTPVIAYKAGGALDYVIPAKTGMLFDKQTVASLVSALKKFDANQYEETTIRRHAANFNRAAFQQKIKDFIGQI